MKKTLLLLAIMLPFIFTSCGDDNDVLSSMEQELVGEWAIIKTTDTQADDYHYVFNKERTGSRRHIVNGEVVTDVPFNWTLNGNTLTLDYIGQKLVMEITMKINQMHVVYVATGATEDYKKVVSTED
ncbi:MAG: hypothetical protein IKW83_07425 [Muribaculaceae bacterium]|nr:hypothetical protein [Muribaculaceae bacterium]